MTFQFDDPIPVDASDVVLQIVFRGTMGGETDAVVIGTRNISEPTFFGFANISDYVWDDPNKRFMALPFGRYTGPDATVNLKLHMGSPTGPVLATLARLDARQHAQVALLTDPGTHTLYVESESEHYVNASPMPADFPATEFYSPPGTQLYDANVQVRLRRGIYRQNYLFYGLPADHTIYFCTPTDEHCVQSTLPSLSPASAVAWTVTF
jgi:hypothetical protein